MGAGLIFESCNSGLNFSVTKRHYRNGFYVDRTASRQQPVSQSTQSVAKSGFETKPLDVLIDNQPEQPLVASTVRTEFNGIKTTTLGKSINQGVSPINRTVLQINKPVSEMNVINNSDKIKSFSKMDDTSSPGYWVWTIIGILLLIWLLSLLTGGWGLGGLIYIFLVVAIILLIFRLLSIL